MYNNAIRIILNAGVVLYVTVWVQRHIRRVKGPPKQTSFTNYMSCTIGLYNDCVVCSDNIISTFSSSCLRYAYDIISFLASSLNTGSLAGAPWPFYLKKKMTTIIGQYMYIRQSHSYNKITTMLLSWINNVHVVWFLVTFCNLAIMVVFSFLPIKSWSFLLLVSSFPAHQS